jgi:hypothetical protein
MHSLYDCYREHLVHSVSSCRLKSRHRIYTCQELISATKHFRPARSEDMTEVVVNVQVFWVWRCTTGRVVTLVSMDRSAVTFRVSQSSVTSCNTINYVLTSLSLPPHCVALHFHQKRADFTETPLNNFWKWRKRHHEEQRNSARLPLQGNGRYTRSPTSHCVTKCCF